jgi:hypothetical protein
MSKLLMSLYLQVPRLKQWHLKWIHAPEWNQKVVPSWQTATRWAPNKQQTNAWKVTGGDEGIQLPVVKIMLPQANFKAALTAYLSTLGFTKVGHMWSFLVFGLTKDSTASIRFWSDGMQFHRDWCFLVWRTDTACLLTLKMGL